MRTFTAAAAQIEARPGDIPANLALHLAAISEARAVGIDLLVFPELSLTDYLLTPDLALLARSAAAAELTELAAAARSMTVSVGFIEEAEGRFHNAQALLGDGRVLQVHRKANLPTYGRLQEGLHYAPGRRVETVALGESWTAATLICADAWNPALPWLAALGGATLLIVPIASSRDAVGDDFDNPGGWSINLRHTALTYGLPIVMANHCGSRGDLRFWGGSCILDASGRELAKADGGPGLVVAQIDPEDGRRARERLPTVRDADPELVQSELARWLQKRGGRSRRSNGF